MRSTATEIASSGSHACDGCLPPAVSGNGTDAVKQALAGLRTLTYRVIGRRATVPGQKRPDAVDGSVHDRM